VGKPLGDLGGFVVDDVVDPRFATLDCDRGGRGGVIDVQERPDPGARTDEEELDGVGRGEQMIGAALPQLVVSANPSSKRRRSVRPASAVI
jgi:hypothetical protein